MLADKYQYKEFCQILRGGEGGGGPPRGIIGKSPGLPTLIIKAYFEPSMANIRLQCSYPFSNRFLIRKGLEKTVVDFIFTLSGADIWRLSEQRG